MGVVIPVMRRRAFGATCLLLLFVVACAPWAPSSSDETSGPRATPPIDAAVAIEIASAPAPPDASTSPKTDAPAPPATHGCLRQRKSFVYRCSGVPPRPGEPNSTPTLACDR